MKAAIEHFTRLTDQFKKNELVQLMVRYLHAVLDYTNNNLTPLFFDENRHKIELFLLDELLKADAMLVKDSLETLAVCHNVGLRSIEEDRDRVAGISEYAGLLFCDKKANGKLLAELRARTSEELKRVSANANVRCSYNAHRVKVL